MAPSTAAFSPTDTIRILVATDNHVGYAERDPERGDDSWKAFHEVMCLAKERDVDMVLLAGDLFHENKPSRKSMYHVMQSLRMNCLGDRPCELEMLSDASESFAGVFNHVNYEDLDINVAIPVFSIHGNHDDPTGEGHFAALDVLQVAGLVNYYGRTPESDRIAVKPVLLQKGGTKLALYGLSNVRDERLFRTFRDGHVKFYQPAASRDDWFNLMSVHQNHVPHTATGYLPENFLPGFLDLVVWGHEHECLIEPRLNPEMGFHVMQPGSSVATALMPGEAVPKHVAVLSVCGKDFKVDPVRLKSVRPFVMREVILADEPAIKHLWKRENNRSEITRFLIAAVEELIAEARQQWCDLHDGDDSEFPKPIVRLRVEYSAPEGGRYDCENPQRFSNRFMGRVANVNDVVQFHRKKAKATRRTRDQPEMPDEALLADMSLDRVSVERLIKEFLEAQSLTILPQNTFGDAVSQFVDKDDKQSVEVFVNKSLSSQLKHLLAAEGVEEDDMAEAMDQYRSKLEELFAAGHLRQKGKARYKPKPDGWDDDIDGNWEEQPGALLEEDDDEMDVDEDEEESFASVAPKPARGRATKAAAASKKAPAKKAPAPAKKPAPVRGRGRRPFEEEEDDEEEEEEEGMVIDDDDEDEEEASIDTNDDLFVRPRGGRAKAPAKAPAKKPAPKPAPKKTPAKKAPAKAPARSARQTTQTTLDSYSQRPPRRAAAAAGTQATAAIEISDDEISDDDDGFESMVPKARGRR
ncbi:DNA repair exonuclease [Trichodelitschia bisporula]|uniref:Double-strand break repair protein n=1 Tax=Trichodelitschia bisporula TaxID=703511 RepID=A0A6G1I0C5_9PEZI|nr:DNA repair exonuclease [Trichodelitschia bisporula]